MSAKKCAMADVRESENAENKRSDVAVGEMLSNVVAMIKK